MIKFSTTAIGTISLGIICSACTGELGSNNLKNKIKTDPTQLSLDQKIVIVNNYAKVENRSPKTVGNLADEFTRNSLLAEEKYTGKSIKLLAKINSVDGDGSGYINVILKDPYEDFSFDFVTCKRVTKPTARRLFKGEIHNVYGVITTTDYGVGMNWCLFPDLENTKPSEVLQKYINMRNKAENQKGVDRETLSQDNQSIVKTIQEYWRKIRCNIFWENNFICPEGEL